MKPKLESELGQYLAKMIRIAKKEPRLRQRIGKSQKLEPQVSLTLVARRGEMSQLNWAYRKKRKPTDVLSIEVPMEFRDVGLLGEIILCLPVARAQARALGHTLGAELKVLLTHGFLHLLGFDHERSKKDAIEMRLLEEKLLGRSLKGLIGRSE